jgi:DNA replication protein DnaC
MLDNNIRIFPTTTQATAHKPQPEETCPTCNFPLADQAFGWVKEYSVHDLNAPGHSERCAQRYGFCLIPCPTCSGGVEAKRHAQLINDLFGDSNIPHYAKEWTFATFPADASRKALAETRTQISLWLANKPTKQGLYLHGDKGQCKTSLAISALRAWLKKGHSGVFIGTADLFSRLKDAIAASKRNEDYQDRYEASQGAKLLRLVKQVELLVLDDLGVECGSKYEIRELYLILEARRSHGLYTIFTSNRGATDLKEYWCNAQDGVFADGLRIIDRLGEYCFAVPVAGRNQRRK